MGRKKGELANLIRESEDRLLYRVQMEFAHGGYITFFRGIETISGRGSTTREFASFEKAMKWFLGLPATPLQPNQDRSAA